MRAQKKMKVRTELTKELTLQPLEVKGNIPSWLFGTLIRNGPIQVSIIWTAKQSLV